MTSVNSSPLSPRFLSSPSSQKSDSPKENLIANKATDATICAIIAPIPQHSKKANILLTSLSPIERSMHPSPRRIKTNKENVTTNKVTIAAAGTIIAPTPKRSKKATILTSTSPVQRPTHPSPRKIRTSPIIKCPIAIRPGKINMPSPTSPVERPINPTPLEIKTSNKKYFATPISRSLSCFSFSDDEKCYVGSIKDYNGYSKGFILFPDQSTYEGECLNYIPHGSGTFKFIDGTKHTGSFAHGTPLNFKSYAPTPPSAEEKSPSPIEQKIRTASDPISIPPRKKKLKPKPVIHKLQTI